MRKKVSSIQIARSVAVLSVLAFHISEMIYAHFPIRVDRISGLGNFGVDLFFVISGLVISQVAPLGGSLGSVLSFAGDRITRIYPPYWFYSALLVGAFLCEPSLVNSVSTSTASWPKSFLLIPQVQPPLLLVGWTLVHEMYFYLLVCVSCLTKKPIAVVSCVIVAFVVISATIGKARELPSLALAGNPMNLEFLLGFWMGQMGMARLVGMRRGAAILLAIWMVFVVILVNTMDIPRHDISPGFRVLAYGAPSGVLLLGLVGLERLFQDRLVVLTLIGDASYSIYLSHTLALAVIGKLIDHVHFLVAGPLAVGLVAMMSATLCLVWGIGSYKLVEKPMLRLLKLLRPGIRRRAVETR
jgi:exopolysaccharide production protein ExoZ